MGEEDIKELEKKLNEMKIKKKKEIEEKMEKLQEELKDVKIAPEYKKRGRTAMTDEEKAERSRIRAREYYSKNREKILERQRARSKIIKEQKEQSKIASFKLNL